MATTLRALRPVLPYRGTMPLVGASLSADEEQAALRHAQRFGWKMAEVLTPAYAPYNALVLVGSALEPYVATIDIPPVEIQKFNQHHDDHGRFSSAGSGGTSVADGGPSWFLRANESKATEHTQQANAAPTGSATEAYHKGAAAAHAAVSAAVNGGGSSAPDYPRLPTEAGPGWFAGVDRLTKNSEAYHQGAAAAHSAIGRVIDRIKNGGLSTQWLGEHGWG